MNGLEQVEQMKKLSESLREEQARKNREKYPITASMVDEFRAVFGDGVKVMSTDERQKLKDMGVLK